MQTVRRYMFFTAIGLVAALVFVSPSSNLLDGWSGLGAGEDGIAGKTVLLHLLAAVIIFMLVKQAASGIPNMFRSRLQRLRRNITLLLLTSLLATLFLFN